LMRPPPGANVSLGDITDVNAIVSDPQNFLLI